MSRWLLSLLEISLWACSCWQALCDESHQSDFETCLRLKSPPKDFKAFSADVLSKGWPTVLEDAGQMFGPKIARWSNLTSFIEQFGTVKMGASVFNVQRDRPGQGMTTSAGDGVDRYGLTPVDGGRYLWMPFSKSLPLGKILNANSAAYMSFVEEGKLALQAEDKREREVQQPEMFKQWRKPSFLKQLIVDEVNIWAGKVTSKRPKESPLHHDPFENLMLQLVGRKTFIMVSALETANVHPRFMKARHAPPPDDFKSQGRVSGSHDLDNFSPVDPDRPDYDQFPLFKQAKQIRCHLDPGEALFMPAFTWHNVLSYGDAESGINLGVNAWFQPYNETLAEQIMAELVRLTGPTPESRESSHEL